MENNEFTIRKAILLSVLANVCVRLLLNCMLFFGKRAHGVPQIDPDMSGTLF